MNRRSFLGFACGGVVAAPAALIVGERASAYPAPAAMQVKDDIRAWGQRLEIHVSGADGDAHVRRFIQQAMLEQRSFMARKG